MDENAPLIYYQPHAPRSDAGHSIQIPSIAPYHHTIREPSLSLAIPQRSITFPPTPSLTSYRPNMAQRTTAL